MEWKPAVSVLFPGSAWPEQTEGHFGSESTPASPQSKWM